VVDREVDGDDTVLILTEKAQVIRVHLNEVRETGRITQGVIMAVPDTGDAVSAIRAMKTREAPADLLSEEEIAASGTEEAPQNGTVTGELVEGSEDTAFDEFAPEDEAPETEEED
jgi:DNA gyrase subunit A